MRSAAMPRRTAPTRKNHCAGRWQVDGPICVWAQADLGKSWRACWKMPHGRKEPVRFDSFRFRTFRKFIGSVRFGSENSLPGSMRFGLRFSDASWLGGPVRFGSVPRPVPAGSGIERFGSVRFGSAGSVRFLLPPCIMISTTSIKWSLRCMAYVHIKRL